MKKEVTYYTTHEAARLMELGVAAVAHHCRKFWAGKGVIKAGRDWRIPAELITQRRKAGRPRKEAK